MARPMIRSSDDELLMVRPITQVTPYYNNPDMLKLHMENLACYPDDMLQQYFCIYVDDGSTQRPDEILKARDPRINTRLFRVLEDIPWNQHGARNLGAKMADTEWLWCADMDRIMLYPWMRVAMNATLLQRPYASRGMDRRKNLSKVDPPKMTNQFFVPKNVYWAAGGYDEWYSGTYGGDFEFIEEMQKVSGPMEFIPGVYHFRYSRHVVEDSTTDLDRDAFWIPHKQKCRQKMLAGKKQMVKPINFEWKEIEI